MTPEVQEEILARIIGGETVLAICADSHMPSKSTVFKFLAGSGEEKSRISKALQSRGDLSGLTISPS